MLILKSSALHKQSVISYAFEIESRGLYSKLRRRIVLFAFSRGLHRGKSKKKVKKKKSFYELQCVIFFSRYMVFPDFIVSHALYSHFTNVFESDS